MWIWVIGVESVSLELGREAGPRGADAGEVCMGLMVKRRGPGRAVPQKDREQLFEECSLRGQAEVDEGCQEGKGENARKTGGYTEEHSS